MNCAEARELQSNYIDEDLIESARARIDDHLASCAACRADFAAVAAAVERLRHESRREEAAPWFTDRVLDRLARENETTNAFVAEDDPTQMAFQDL